jgi:fructose-bisphosphate aldolase, class I
MHGKKIRMGKLIDPKYGRGIIVPYSHGVSRGPIKGSENLEQIKKNLEIFKNSRANGVLFNAGYLKYCEEYFIGRDALSLVLVIDWMNRGKEYVGKEIVYDELRTLTYKSIDEAIRYGADAVFTYLTFGFDDPSMEAEEIRRNGFIVSECEKVGLPVIIEPLMAKYGVKNIQSDKDYLKINCRIAAEVGADIVKAHYSGDPESFGEVVDGCAAPIMIGGGPDSCTMEELLKMVKDSIKAGGAGTIIGRKIFQSEDVVKRQEELCKAVFDDQGA